MTHLQASIGLFTVIIIYWMNLEKGNIRVSDIRWVREVWTWAWTLTRWVSLCRLSDIAFRGVNQIVTLEQRNRERAHASSSPNSTSVKIWSPLLRRQLNHCSSPNENLVLNYRLVVRVQDLFTRCSAVARGQAVVSSHVFVSERRGRSSPGNSWIRYI